MITKRERRLKIKKRVRKHISGTTERPRLSVFRSNRQIYAQVIDDTTGKTLAATSPRRLWMPVSRLSSSTVMVTSTMVVSRSWLMPLARQGLSFEISITRTIA